MTEAGLSGSGSDHEGPTPSFSLVVEPDWASLSEKLEAELVSHSECNGNAFEYGHLAIKAVTSRGEMLGGVRGYVIQGRFSVEELAVLRRWRGHGVGRALLRALEDRVAGMGITSIYLGTWDFQAPAFYEALGYEPFGRLPEIHGHPGKTWLAKRLQVPQGAGETAETLLWR